MGLRLNDEVVVGFVGVGIYARTFYTIYHPKWILGRYTARITRVPIRSISCMLHRKNVLISPVVSSRSTKDF